MFMFNVGFYKTAIFQKQKFNFIANMDNFPIAKW